MALEQRHGCPICGSGETRTIYVCPYRQEPMTSYLRFAYRDAFEACQAALADGVYQLDECRDCRGIFQTHVGDAALMEKEYSEWSRPADLQADQQSHPLKYYLRRTQEVVSLIAHFQGTSSRNGVTHDLSVLDYGMGWGEFCQMARSFGCRTWGYDISQPVLERARQHGLQVIADPDQTDQQFDIINAEQVFEHLPDPLGTLRSLKRMLTPRGVIRVCVPSARRIHANLQRETFTAHRHAKTSLNAVAPLEHINCFAGDSLSAMGRAAGLLPFQLAEGLPIGIKGALKEAARPLLSWLGLRMKNVCYYRLPAAEQTSRPPFRQQQAA